MNSVISAVIGALSATIFAVVVKFFVIVHENIIFSKFKSMLISEYIDELFNLPKDGNKFGNIVERLTYLKKEEAVYINYSNQIKFIRLIEFSKMVGETLGTISKAAGFTGLEIQTKGGKDDREKIEYNKIKLELRKTFDDNVDNYLNLKTDIFISDTEKEKYKKRIEEA